jgi:hypothetical protein
MRLFFYFLIFNLSVSQNYNSLSLDRHLKYLADKGVIDESNISFLKNSPLTKQDTIQLMYKILKNLDIKKANIEDISLIETILSDMSRYVSSLKSFNESTSRDISKLKKNIVILESQIEDFKKFSAAFEERISKNENNISKYILFDSNNIQKFIFESDIFCYIDLGTSNYCPENSFLLLKDDYKDRQISKNISKDLFNYGFGVTLSNGRFFISYSKDLFFNERFNSIIFKYENENPKYEPIFLATYGIDSNIKFSKGKNFIVSKQFLNEHYSLIANFQHINLAVTWSPKLYEVKEKKYFAKDVSINYIMNIKSFNFEIFAFSPFETNEGFTNIELSLDIPIIVKNLVINGGLNGYGGKIYEKKEGLITTGYRGFILKYFLTAYYDNKYLDSYFKLDIKENDSNKDYKYEKHLTAFLNYFLNENINFNANVYFNLGTLELDRYSVSIEVKNDFYKIQIFKNTLHRDTSRVNFSKDPFDLYALKIYVKYLGFITETYLSTDLLLKDKLSFYFNLEYDISAFTLGLRLFTFSTTNIFLDSNNRAINSFDEFNKLLILGNEYGETNYLINKFFFRASVRFNLR